MKPNPLLSPPNVRFWVWINDGWTRLKLRQGQTVVWGQAYKTDEGFHRESVSWFYQDNAVGCRWRSGGRDCDGPIDHLGECTCVLEKLQSRLPCDINEQNSFQGIPLRLPDWVAGPMEVRDAYAEAAGY